MTTAEAEAGGAPLTAGSPGPLLDRDDVLSCHWTRQRIGAAAGPRPRTGPHLAQCEPPQWPRTRIWGNPFAACPAAPHQIWDAHSPNANPNSS
eukprot:364256-Chlamydomonas_euryale.AAC.8